MAGALAGSVDPDAAEGGGDVLDGADRHGQVDLVNAAGGPGADGGVRGDSSVKVAQLA